VFEQLVLLFAAEMKKVTKIYSFLSLCVCFADSQDNRFVLVVA